MQTKKTVVLGASENPERYSHRAVQQLVQHGHPVVAVGLKEGHIDKVSINKGFPDVENTDTVTMYVGAKNQPVFYNYILQQLKPKRIIFNPGAENPELEDLARKQGIEVTEACTLVLLSIGDY